MGIFSFFRRKKDAPAQVSMVGQPVYAGRPRTGERRRRRNEKRIERVQQMLAKDPGNESLIAELQRRTSR